MRVTVVTPLVKDIQTVHQAFLSSLICSLEFLRQVLDVDQQLQGTGEELADSSVVTEESRV